MLRQLINRQVVKNQLDRDEAICDLLESMAIMYGFTVPLEVMRRDHTELDSTLVDVIKQILQQTIECSLFVQEYSGKGFAGTLWLTTLIIVI